MMHYPLSIRLLPIITASVLAACGARSGSELPSALKPIASIQELMQSEIDTSADGVWDAVETVVTAQGTEERQPHTPEEWEAVRRAAITLIEGTNLLVMDGRRVGAREFPAEAEGALNSQQIAERIAANRPAFNAFAVSLREAGLTALAAVDAKDPDALLTAGGHLDEICEACHVTFWYPNQKIPAVANASRP
jgi:cytochrome c556